MKRVSGVLVVSAYVLFVCGIAKAQDIDLHGPARVECDSKWLSLKLPASEYRSYIESCIPKADVCHCWTPSMQQIAQVETKLEGRALPLGNLDRYARYYAGVIDRHTQRRFIRGKLVPLDSDPAPGTHIVEGQMPPLKEDGCISNSDPEGGPWI